MAGVSTRALVVAIVLVAAISIGLTALTDAGALGLQLFAVAGMTIALVVLLWPQLRGDGR